MSDPAKWSGITEEWRRAFEALDALAANMNENKENIVPLQKRKSPSDYMDGYLAGLRAARELLDRSIEKYEETRKLFEVSRLDKDSPGKPEN